MMAPGTGVRERPPRFLVALPAKVMVVDQAVPGSHRVLTAATANVSEGGMALDLQEALPPWTPVEVQVERPEGTVALEAIVLWHEDLSSRRGTSGVRHGLMLSHLPQGARQGWDVLLKGLGHVGPPRASALASRWRRARSARCRGGGANPWRGGPRTSAVGAWASSCRSACRSGPVWRWRS